MLRNCELEGVEQLAKENRQKQIVQSRLNHERQQVATLKIELHQVRTQRPVSPGTLGNPIRIELEDGLQATQAEEQVQVDLIRQAEQKAQVELQG
eukprot:12933658-Prorocentrum_lima.AAC.1